MIPEPNGRPYRLPQAAGRELLDGDRVAIEPDRMRGEGLPSARLVRVLERRRTHVVGRVVEGRPRRLLPSDRAMAAHVVLLEDGGPEAPAGATVAARITKYPTSWSGITATVEEVLGETGSLVTEIRTICYGLGIPEEALGLYSFDGSDWHLVATSVVAERLNRVTGTTNHFGVFAVLHSETTGLENWETY